MNRRLRLLVLALLGLSVFLGLAFLALWACGIIVYEPSQYAKFHRDFPYTKVTAMEVALLAAESPPSQDATERHRIAALPRFQEYPIDGAWRSIDPEYLERATSLIFSRPVLSGSYPAECFFPGFALKITTDVGRVDMLVCLRCEQVLVRLPDKLEGWYLPFTEEGLKSAKAFYADCFVMNNLGLKPAP